MMRNLSFLPVFYTDKYCKYRYTCTNDVVACTTLQFSRLVPLTAYQADKSVVISRGRKLQIRNGSLYSLNNGKTWINFLIIEEHNTKLVAEKEGLLQKAEMIPETEDELK